MKLLDKLGDWVWHVVFEKVGGLPCNKCMEKWHRERNETPKQDINKPKQTLLPPQEERKNRYGCPQDYSTAKEFIDSL